MTTSKQGFSTKLVHGGEAPDPLTGAVAPVLVRSKTFQQPGYGLEAEWQYSRGKNPTRSILEHKLESLVGEGQATVFGSGDAATTMLLLTLKPGDRIICCQQLYGGTIRLLDQLFKDFGIGADYVDVENIDAIKAVQTERTVAILTESPTNPQLGIIDLQKVSDNAKTAGLRLILDLTFAPPVAINPFEYGAETVIYSLSKYFAGHNDVIGGAIVTRNQQLHDRLVWLQWSVGACLSPDECYRTIQELKTLELRWKRVSETAQVVAEHLQQRTDVARVYYPGLASHPGHDVAVKQFKNGFGAVLGFDLKTTDETKLRQFVHSLQSSGLVIYGESLASPETILAHPATMSHRSLTPEHRRSIGISDTFFRLSVGLEDAADLTAVLDEALGLSKGRLLPAVLKESIVVS